MNGEETKQRIDEFHKRWDIVQSEDYEVEFQKFRDRIINFLKDCDIDKFVDYNNIKLFCKIVGIPYKLKGSYHVFSENIIDAFKKEQNEKKFYLLINIIFYLKYNSQDYYRNEYINKKIYLYNEIKDIIDISNINLKISVVKGEVILYPKGENTLDKILVNEVLTILNSESLLHFSEALKFYMEGSSRSFIKCAESLRRSLEEFIRNKLSNTKGLKENIIVLLNALKTNGNDKEIRKIIFQVFNYLDEYFNENSKHNDGDIDETECEYLIYQTGLLLRYINNIKLNLL